MSLILPDTFSHIQMHGTKTLDDIFEKGLIDSDRIRIAVGYISASALIDLKKWMEDNLNNGIKIPRIEIIIGLHFFEKFTANQLKALYVFCNFLEEKKLGYIKMCNTFPYHGKVYAYYGATKMLYSTIGSSNLSGITKNPPNFEVDILLDSSHQLSQIEELLNQLDDKCSTHLKEYRFDDLLRCTEVEESPLEGTRFVQKISSGDTQKVAQSLNGVKFEIPLKHEPKSNLNCYFGKGRETKSTKIVRPRPWYEVEIIVSKYITNDPQYPPAGRDFTVVTDDGWKFECSVNGQNKKNFRSSHDLQTLGRWLKGRLENSGALEVGNPVTKAVFDSYGRDSFSLMGTDLENTWYLDYSRGGKK